THYEKSDWSRAFNQFTIACELDMILFYFIFLFYYFATHNEFPPKMINVMINVISAADIAFIMSSSTSAWLPSPLECSPQKQNG
ncbi:unnamed protein product, partial [Porites lobata]